MNQHHNYTYLVITLICILHDFNTRRRARLGGGFFETAFSRPSVAYRDTIGTFQATRNDVLQYLYDYRKRAYAGRDSCAVVTVRHRVRVKISR